MKKILYTAVILVILFLGYNYFTKPNVPANSENKSPIVLGYVGPLTGPSAVLGMDAVKAIEIWVNEINSKGGVDGRKVSLISEDDQYLVKNTVSAYQKLTQVNKAKIVLVATYGGFLALRDVAVKDGVILINPLDCNKDIANASKNLFCLATETESIGDVLAEQMIANKQLVAGVMYSTKDEFMNLVTAAFKKKFEAAGGKVFVESFNYEDKDFKSSLSKLNSQKIAGLVLLGHDETGVIMKQARSIGIKVPFYTTGTITSPGAQEASGGASEGTVFAYWDAESSNVKSQDFVSKFLKLVGRPPILPLTTHPAYDVVSILGEKVLPGLNSDFTVKDLKDKLLNVSGYSGITGTVNFDQNGASPIKESAFKLVKGAPQKI
jgi:branched-chain amino acid transport system substrate-binding protein